MFFDTDIKGYHLPPKTICFTYDDGPGPQTRELGRYLAAEGVPATFFVVGAHAAGQEDVLQDLRACGHLVGNHTWSHPGLVALAAAGGDVVGEIERTDALVRPHADGETVLFRAPYGNWREKKPGSDEDKATSIVCDILNRSGRFPRTVGPVNWDITAEDWDCWFQGVPPEEAACRYVVEVDQVGRGLILMHDHSEEVELRSRNRTPEMTRLLVPVLKEKGYRFVRLDEVPQVRSALRVRSQVLLRAEDEKVLSRPCGSGAIVLGDGEGEPPEPLGVVDLGGRRVALRAGNGLFVAARPGGAVAAEAAEVKGPAVLRWE